MWRLLSSSLFSNLRYPPPPPLPSVVRETITSTTILTSLPPSEFLFLRLTFGQIICRRLEGKYSNYCPIIAVEEGTGEQGCFCCVSSRCYRGNRRIHSAEYVRQCRRAGTGEECLHAEQQWNVFLFMWGQISTPPLRSGKSVVVRPLKASPSQSFSITYGLSSAEMDKQTACQR